MRILTRGWYFYCSSPVKVKVTQSKCQMLYFTLFKRRIVLWNIEMHWLDTTLVRSSRSKEEIKFVFRIVTFNQILINKTAWRWVWQVTSTICNEESLRDSFIYNDNCDLRACLYFVEVSRFDRSFKLRDFVFKNLISLSITNTISVYNNVGWTLILVVRLKSLDCFNDWLNHVCSHKFLAFLLNKMLTVVLRHFTVDACRKANNWVRAWMAYINTDKHCPFLIKYLRELHVVQISTNFTVHLL